MFCTACGTANSSLAERCATCATPFPTAGRGPRRRQAAVVASPSNVGSDREANPLVGGVRPGALSRPRWRSTAGSGRRLRAVYVATLVMLLAASVALGARYRAEEAERARWYARGTDAAAAGHPAVALAAYASAAGYRDAEARRAAILAPYQEAVEQGQEALDAERYDEAIAALKRVARDLPADQQARTLLEQARAGREADLLRQVDTAEVKRDWLAAEQALTALVAVAPDDALIERLAAIRREHAPITFTRDGALYLAGPNGDDERLLADVGFASWQVWSPDRTRIAFLVADQTDPASLAGALYVVDTTGGTPIKFADDVLLRWWPAWSPDGTQIAYSSIAAFDITRFEGTIGVRVVDTRTGVETDLTGGRFAYAGPPTWSPTGDRLAFVKREIDATDADEGRGVRFGNGDVHVMTMATGETHSVTGGYLPDAFRVAWSPTGERLLVLTLEASAAYGTELSSVHLLDLTTGDLTPASGRDTDAAMPVWSPDGTRFAYVESSVRVRIRTLGGEEIWIDAPGPLAGHLTWSPDGGALLAASSNAWTPSTIINVAEKRADQAFPLDHDSVQPSGVAAPPQWSPANPSPPPAAPTISGTALDPEQADGGFLAGGTGPGPEGRGAIGGQATREG